MTNLKVKAALDVFYWIGAMCSIMFICNIIGGWVGIPGSVVYAVLFIIGLIYMMYSMRLRDLEFQEKFPEIYKE
jgi:hypothetical protein